MNKRKLRITVVLLGVLAAVLILWIECKSISSSVLALFLRQVGFQQASFDNFWPGLSSTSLSNFNFFYSTTSADIQGQANKLVFDYTFSSLRSGKLDSISLKDGIFTFNNPREGLFPDDSAKDLKGWGLDKVFSNFNSLPFNKVNIDNLDLLYSGHNLFLDALDFSILPYPHLDISAKILNKFNHKVEVDFLKSDQIKLSADSTFETGKLSCAFNAKILSNNSVSLSNGDGCNLKAKAKNYNAIFQQTLLQKLSAESSKIDSLFTLSGSDSLNGLAKLSVDVESSKKKAKILVTEGNLSQEFIQIKEAQFTTVFGFLDRFTSIEPVRIKIGSLVFGIPVQDILVQFDYSADELSHVLGNAKIAGGIVKLLSSKISLGEQNWQLSVTARDLSLKQLLASYPQSAVEAEGQVDIEFNLNKTFKGFEINSGYLAAKGGGIIRVIQDNLAQNHPELSLVMDQLHNFHFDKLEGVINLDAEGNLILSLSIGGKNPNLESKRMLDLNLKLEDNLFALAKTLRLINGNN